MFVRCLIEPVFRGLDAFSHSDASRHPLLTPYFLKFFETALTYQIEGKGNSTVQHTGFIKVFTVPVTFAEGPTLDKIVELYFRVQLVIYNRQAPILKIHAITRLAEPAMFPAGTQ